MSIKTVIINSNLEQVSRFKYLSCAVNYESEYDIKEKINKFRKICGTIHINFRNKTRHKDYILKNNCNTHIDLCESGVGHDKKGKRQDSEC